MYRKNSVAVEKGIEEVRIKMLIKSEISLHHDNTCKQLVSEIDPCVCKLAKEVRNRCSPYCFEASFILHFSLLYAIRVLSVNYSFAIIPFLSFCYPLLLMNNKGSSFFPFI